MKTLKLLLTILLTLGGSVQAHADGTISMTSPSISTGSGWTFSGSVVTITDSGNYVVTGTSNEYRIVVKEVKATITLRNVTIRSAVASPFVLSSDDTGGSDVTLILEGSNTLLTTNIYSAGLTVEDSAKITIQGDGSLFAQGAGANDPDYGSHGGAGIGSEAGKKAGTVIINSGTITAIGGYIAAGISANVGSGYVTITGGTVTATGGIIGSAGIGGGANVHSGNVTITGGTVTAIGGNQGAGIGGGVSGSGGNITITGGTVTATGGEYAAGIGGGYGGEGGNITIGGGMITATGIGGVGIGGGVWASGGNITIHGGTIVAATSGGRGDPAGIGGGAWGNAGTVNISGGTIYASGGTGAGIGGGAGATGGVINITGGTVIADEIGIGAASGRTETHISGAKTVALSPSINTTSFGQAKVLTGDSVNVSDAITTGDTIADVTLNAALTIPSGAILVAPAGIVFDVNNKVLTNSGIIREYGSLRNKGNLTGAQTVGAIQANWITIPNQSYAYTGDSIKPTITVTNGTLMVTNRTLTVINEPLTLTSGVYYSVAYKNNVNAGTAMAIVTDLGDYHTNTITFTIASKPIANVRIEDISARTYTGDSIKPPLTVTEGDKTLTLNTDYTVAYTNNVKVGTTATATITGTGNYNGSASKTFTITQKSIADGWIQNIPEQTWTGKEITPAVTVKDGDKTLTPGTDYTVELKDNINVGTGRAEVTGTGNYTGTASKTFTITNAYKSIAADWIQQDILEWTYTGDSIKPDVTVRDKDDDRPLVVGTDYTVAYSGNVDAGEATINITGKGNYSGTVYKYFTINPKAVSDDWLESISEQTYTGDSIVPAITVRDGDSILIPGRDYTVAGSDNVDAGEEATVTITGRGNYTGNASQKFTITPKQIADGWIQDISNQTYTGNAIEPAITVRDGNRILERDKDYTVAGSDIDAGAATVTITGRGNYTGSTSKSFTITPKPLADARIEDIPAWTYTGDSIKSDVVVTDGDRTLELDRDYIVTYINNVNKGTAIVTITGTGNYTGTVNQTFTINPKEVAGDWLESISEQTYTGSAIEPAITVKDGDRILERNTDYTIEGYSNHVDAGEATVTITGMGNYTGSASTTFIIAPKPIADDWLESISEQTYTGDSIKPDVIVKDDNAAMTEGIHYSVTYSNNVNAGTETAEVTVTGVGNYTGTATQTFTINPKEVADDWLEDISEQTYTGEAIEPAITVKDSDWILERERDYTVDCSDNVDAGAATVTITGTGNYTGSASKTFIINPKPFADVRMEDIPILQIYTGDSIKPAVIIQDGDRTLTLNTDYTVAGSDNVDAGVATVTITGMGNYTGSISKTFIISPKPIADDWILDIPAQTYTGDSIKPTVIIQDDNRILKPGTDYTLNYTNNTNAGTATVTVTGQGNYSGSTTTTFSIIRNTTTIQESWVQDIPDQYYTGSTIEPYVTVTGLVLNRDYTVSYTNHVNPGTASAIITGIGNYTGTITKTFNILRASGETYSVNVSLTVSDDVKSYVTLSFTSMNVKAGTVVPLVIYIASEIETTAPIVYANNSPIYVSDFDAERRIYTTWITVQGNTQVIVSGLVSTGVEEAGNSVLRIVSEGNGILISGLTPGEAFGIYTLQGQLVYQAQASSPEEHIYLQDKGVYILRHKDKAYKFSR